MNIWTDLLFAICWIWLSIYIHEIGHFVKAEKLGYKAKMGFRKGFAYTRYWKEENVNAHIPIKDRIKITNNGILLGGLAAVLSLFIVPYWSPMIVLVYFFGCKQDFKDLKRFYSVLRETKHLNITSTKE